MTTNTTTMTKTQKEVARRLSEADHSRHFRDMRGMLWDNGTRTMGDFHGLGQDRVREDTLEVVTKEDLCHCFPDPDLSDPATAGCIKHLALEAWSRTAYYPVVLPLIPDLARVNVAPDLTRFNVVFITRPVPDFSDPLSRPVGHRPTLLPVEVDVELSQDLIARTFPSEVEAWAELILCAPASPEYPKHPIAPGLR